ncbi:uncharacterized protein [Nicotiana sylvestris]|uniref:Uncharacterized protein LOC104227228 isoform X2 n=1 Tax=Nicotiana sylvestris TaxID=4096 RepID=A0A1U7WSS8_NICSY|nr:PREDICTED: uncharacterized protein LOC104227228 isoform X2 [Nicotiana sylvestris]
MAEREIPCKSCEFPSRGRERELVEEEECMDEEEVDDSNDSDESDGAIIYDSDDSDFDIVDGPNADRKVWNQYYREWNESEGFDISVHPGASFMAPIAQLRSYLKNPKEKQIYTELCNLAIGIFNSQNVNHHLLLGRGFISLFKPGILMMR